MKPKSSRSLTAVRGTFDLFQHLNSLEGKKKADSSGSQSTPTRPGKKKPTVFFGERKKRVNNLPRPSFFVYNSSQKFVFFTFIIAPAGSCSNNFTASIFVILSSSPFLYTHVHRTFGKVIKIRGFVRFLYLLPIYSFLPNLLPQVSFVRERLVVNFE